MQHFEIIHEFPYPMDLFERYINDPRLLEMARGLPHLDERKLLDHWTSEDGRTAGWKFEVWAVSDVPRAARKVMGDKAGWIEQTEYDFDQHRMTFSTKPFIFPDKVTCTGTYALLPSAGGFRREIIGDLEVRVRLAGKLAEKFIVKNLKETYEAEFQIYLKFLEEKQREEQDR